MIVSDFADVGRELDLIRRRLQRLEAAAAEPDVAAVDAMIGRQLDALEKAMAAEWFDDEDTAPVRASRP